MSYKGTDFYGWQKQARHRTVQSEVEKALFRLLGQRLSVIGSGRTDTGAHALAQTAHFSFPSDKWPQRIDLPKALNRFLPSDIAVLKAWLAPELFHAQKSAVKKTYLYLIRTGASPSVLFHELVWQIPGGPLPLEKLNQISALAAGQRDFKSFQNKGSPVRETVRTLYDIHWGALSHNVFACQMTGSGFLKQMARNLVGAFIALLKKSRPEQKLREILNCRDRRSAPATAPARGLYLKQVFYPLELDRACKPL